MTDSNHPIEQKKIEEKPASYQHREIAGGRRSVSRASFNRRHSLTVPTPTSRRASLRQSFDNSNLAMVFPDKTHLEVADDSDTENSIEDISTSWFVWLVAATASIAGSLFGYDTGIISAVLVYLKDDLNHRPTSANEKELITSLCSGGAFIGAIIAGLTADKVRVLPT